MLSNLALKSKIDVIFSKNEVKYKSHRICNDFHSLDCNSLFPNFGPHVWQYGCRAFRGLSDTGFLFPKFRIEPDISGPEGERDPQARSQVWDVRGKKRGHFPIGLGLEGTRCDFESPRLSMESAMGGRTREDHLCGCCPVILTEKQYSLPTSANS